jgi:hypothetical protein
MAYGHPTIADDWFAVSDPASPLFSVTTTEILSYLTGSELNNHGDYGLRFGPAPSGYHDIFHKQTLPVAQSFTGTGVSTVGSNEFEDPGYTFTADDEDRYVEILNAVDPDTQGLHLITSVSAGKAILNGILASETGLDWKLRDGDTAVHRVECISFTDGTSGGTVGYPLFLCSRQDPFTLNSGYKLGLAGSSLMLVQNDGARPIDFSAVYVTTSSIGLNNFNRYHGLRLDTWRQGNDMRIRGYYMLDAADCDTMLGANPQWNPVIDVVHQSGNTTAQVLTIPGITQNNSGAGRLNSTPAYAGAAGFMATVNSASLARYLASPRILRGA